MVKKNQEIKEMHKLLNTGKSVKVRDEESTEMKGNGKQSKILETESQAYLKLETWTQVI